MEEPQGVPAPGLMTTEAAAASDRFLVAARQRAAAAAESAARAAALQAVQDGGVPEQRAVDPGNFVMISLP